MEQDKQIPQQQTWGHSINQATGNPHDNNATAAYLDREELGHLLTDILPNITSRDVDLVFNMLSSDGLMVTSDNLDTLLDDIDTDKSIDIELFETVTSHDIEITVP